jgi:hypothetical protein
MLPLNATDTVSLAMERTKRMLFRPWRFSLFWRMAVLGVFTGEMSSGGFPNFNFSSYRNHPSVPNVFDHHVGLVIAIAILATVFFFVFLYVASVLHFVLFEAVLTGTTRIRQGWRRWRERGRQYFGFSLLMFVISLLIATVIGVPAYVAFRAGVFSTAHLGLAILVGAVLATVALLLLFVQALIWVMTKDLVVPIMMLEGFNVLDGWRRAWPLVEAEGKRYAGFYGLKIVLRIAASLILGVAVVVIIFVIAIPFVIAVVLAVPAMKSVGTGGGIIIGFLVMLAVLVMFCLTFAAVAILGTPIAVFFTSYTLQFFGSRYEPLRALVYPEPPPMPPPLAPIMPIAPVPPPVGA